MLTAGIALFAYIVAMVAIIMFAMKDKESKER